MIKKFYPVLLHFDVEVDYSKDNGVTWLTLPEDTALEIQPDELPSNGRVKVRTVNTLTSLDRDKLQFRSRLYKSINIRNGRSLTTLADVFRDSVIGTLRIANIPNVQSLATTCHRSIMDNFIMPYAPVVTTAANMFEYAYVKAINSITAPKLTHGMLMFKDLRGNNYMGDLTLGKDSSGVGVRSFMQNASITIFPSLDINYLCHTDASSPPSNSPEYRVGQNMLYGLNTPYILYSKIELNLTGYSTYSTTAGYSSMLAYCKSKFTGLDFYISKDSNIYATRYIFRGQELQYPFSRIVRHYGEIDGLFLSSPNIAITEVDKEILEDSNIFKVIELPDWLPDLMVLQDIENVTEIIGKTSFGNLALSPVMYKENGGTLTEYLCETVDNFDTAVFKETVIAGVLDKRFTCKNGFQTIQDGADLKTYNEVDLLLSTISGVTALGANLNQDGTRLYVVTGDVLDPNNLTVQFVTNTVTEYDTSTGTVVDSFVVTTVGNEQVEGVYKPQDESGIHILKTYYESNSVYLIPNSSQIETRCFDGTVVTTDLFRPMNILTTNYGEDNEFTCLNTTFGYMTKCFGK